MLRPLGSRRLKDVSTPKELYQLTIPGLPEVFPPLKTLDPRPTNLPTPATPLIGRDVAVATIARMLRQPHCRLLSLTGPGGIGKTRLALAVGPSLLDDFADGVWLVAMETVTQPALVVSVLASTLGVKEVRDIPLQQTLMEYLQPRRMLLVIDSFEHLVAAAPVLTALVAQAPGVTLLVTTRVLLQVAGEYEYPVDVLPLAVDDTPVTPATWMAAPALALFVAQAQRVQPDFVVTAENLPFLRDICRTVDGLPLALELAAARIRLLSPRTLAERLSQGLSTLTGGAWNLPPRHHTLRRTIDWSYALLEPPEQQLFARLAIFRGGARLEAIQRVCLEPGDLPLDLLDGLTSLLNKSLIRQEAGVGGEPRIMMLETIREYAAELLAQQPVAAVIQQAHSLAMLQLTRQAEEQLRGAQQGHWCDRLQEELPNLRVALHYAVQQSDGVLLASLCGTVWRFWSMRGLLSEGVGWLTQAQAVMGAAPPTMQARVFHGLGLLAWLQGAYPEAEAAFRQALAVRQGLDEAAGSAILLNNLGHLALVRDDLAAATALLSAALTIQRRLDDRWGIAYSIINLSLIALREGRFAEATAACQESLALRRALNDQRGVAGALHNLGWIYLAQTQLPHAYTHFGAALQLNRTLGNVLGQLECLFGLAAVAYAAEDYAVAVPVWQAAEAIRRQLAVEPCPDIRWLLDHYRQQLAAHPAPGLPASAPVTLTHAVALVLAYHGPAGGAPGPSAG
ncbi:MAG TPA: tetratricopeptide repeat protein [Herpetosiphonaceae bacterium]